MTHGHICLMVTQGRKTAPDDKTVSTALGRRERRKQETTEKLFVAAMELFSSKGFAQTKVEDITERADVGKGTFFNYFPSKEHVLGYFAGRQIGTVRQHLQLAQKGEKSTIDVLTSLAHELVRAPGKSPHMARSIVLSFLGNVEVREYVVREMSAGRDLLAEIIKLGQQRGELSDEFSPAKSAMVFQQALFGTLVLWSLDSQSSLAKQMQTTMQVFLSGLRAPAVSEKPKRKREGKL